MKDYMGQVKTLLAMYVPPDPQRMQQAFQSGKASPTGAGGIVFKDYALPGDQMTISFDPAAKKISSVNVNTYMDDPKDTVTLAVVSPASRRHQLRPTKCSQRHSQATPGKNHKRQLPPNRSILTFPSRTRFYPQSPLIGVIGADQC